MLTATCGGPKLDSREYEQAALESLEKRAFVSAEVYARLAEAAEVRELRRVLDRCADPAAREGL